MAKDKQDTHVAPFGKGNGSTVTGGTSLAEAMNKAVTAIRDGNDPKGAQTIITMTDGGDIAHDSAASSLAIKDVQLHSGQGREEIVLIDKIRIH